MPNNLNSDGKKYLYVSSLRAASIYVIKINDDFKKILNEDRIYFAQQRIRDIEYDEENQSPHILKSRALRRNSRIPILRSASKYGLTRPVN